MALQRTLRFEFPADVRNAEKALMRTYVWLGEKIRLSLW